MDSNFLEIVLDECGSVTKNNEIFVYNPLQLCRNLITEGYSMDQLVHFFSENVYCTVLDKKFLSQWCNDIGLQAPSDFCVFLLNDYSFKETIQAYNEIASLTADIEDDRQQISQEEEYLRSEWETYTGTSDANELMSAEFEQVAKWWLEFERLVSLGN